MAPSFGPKFWPNFLAQVFGSSFWPKFLAQVLALKDYNNVVFLGFSGFVQKSTWFFSFLANKKAELALKEKEAALLKLAQMQKEVDNLSGGPLLHVIRRVQDLKTAPMGALKTIEWQLRKDLQEVEKVISFNAFD